MMSDRRTVLVVDDDMSIRRSLQRLLTSAGYDVVVFSSAHESLARAEIPYRACVVLDIRMPGITGTELHAVLLERHPELPVILTSGHADAAMATPVGPLGAVAFLPKPFEAADLFQALDAAFARGSTPNGLTESGLTKGRQRP